MRRPARVYRDSQQSCEGIAQPAWVTGIRHRGQRQQQPGLFTLGHRLSWRQAATDRALIAIQCPFCPNLIDPIDYVADQRLAGLRLEVPIQSRFKRGTSYGRWLFAPAEDPFDDTTNKSVIKLFP